MTHNLHNILHFGFHNNMEFIDNKPSKKNLLPKKAPDILICLENPQIKKNM